MEYRSLGRTGLKVSTLSLGSGNFGDMTSEETAHHLMRAALNAGINYFDTADGYAAGESERIIGRFLKSNNLRDEVIIATKVFYPTGDGPNDRGLSRYHVLRACEASLQRLQTDHIDIYLTHRSASLEVPIEETLSALNDLVRQGKVCYIGCSTSPAWQVMEALMVSAIRGYARFALESPPYNLLDRRIENELVPLCQAYGLGIIPWSPMAMGMLAGRYAVDARFPEGSRAAKNPQGIYAQRIKRRGLMVAEQFLAVARKSRLAPGQLAVLWVKEQPGITSAIVGPRDPAQLNTMVAIAEMRLDEEIRVELDRLNPPGTAVANFHNTSGWMKMQIPDDLKE